MRALAVFCLWLSAGLWTVGNPALAQTDFPQKEITIVVGAPPGGANDIVARLVADNLKLGEPSVPVIVLHKPGAGGQVAADYAAAAAPDGHTVFLGTTAITVGPFLSKSFTPLDSYIPVVNLASLAPLLHVDARLSVNSVPELKAYAEANPGKLAVGSSGGQLDMVPPLLSEAMGVQLKHVPFNGVAEVYTSLLAGDVQMLFASAGSAKPFLEAGQVRTIATGTAERDPLRPDLPTVAEGGAPGFEVRPSWFGIMAPAGTPRPIIEQLNEAFNAALKSPGVEQRLNELGMSVIGGSPEDLAEVLKRDVAAYEKGVKAAGITPK